MKGLMILGLSVVWNLWASTDSVISLIKKKEIYLRGMPSSIPTDWVSPCFVAFADGSIIIDHGFILSLFDQNHNYIKEFGGIGYEPGKAILHGYIGIAISEKDRVIAICPRRRINIFNKDGNLEKSLILSDIFWIVDYAKLYRDSLLVVSGTRMEDDKGFTRIGVFNLNTGEAIRRFFEFTGDSLKMLEEKPLWSAYGPKVYFEISPNGTIFVTESSIDHRVYEYDINGELLHIIGDMPPHYIPFWEAPPIDEKELLTKDDKGLRLTKKGEAWHSSFSKSKPPMIYANDFLVISRYLSPKSHFLDFYSINDRKYIGFCEIGDKPFLFSDCNYIYLCEYTSDTLLIIGKYTATIGKVDAPEIIVLDTIPKELSKELLKPKPDTGRVFDSIEDFMIKDMEGNERPLSTYLPANKKHFLLFMTPFDCGIKELYERGIKCSKEKDADLWIIVNHPFEEEMRLFVYGFQKQVGVPVIPNLAVRNIKRLGIKFTPVLLLTDEKGKIVGRFPPQ